MAYNVEKIKELGIIFPPWKFPAYNWTGKK